MRTAHIAASAVLAAALIACVGCEARQAQTVLVYAFDIPADQEGPAGREGKPDINKAVAVVEPPQLGRRWSRMVKVRRLSDTTLEVRLRTADPATLATIDGLVRVLGSLEFRILANDRDNPGIIERGKALGPDVNKVYSSDGNLEAWWLGVHPGSSTNFTSGAEHCPADGNKKEW